MQRWTAAVCGIGALALAGILLWQPIRHPLFVKFSLNMVGERSNPTHHGRRGAAARLGSQFLAPNVEWSEVVSGVAERFEPPRAGGHPLEPFSVTADLVDAVRAGGGVCNNWTEALLILCADAGRRCREWANIPYPDAPASGHAVIELWLPELARWAMLDAYVGFRARGPDGHPMSVADFEDAMMAGSKDIQLEAIGNRKLRLRDIDSYYRNERSVLVEVTRNDPVSLSMSWTRPVERVSKSLGQLMQWTLGLSPRYVVPDDERHRELREHMQMFRTRLAAGTVFVLLGIGALSWALLGPRSSRQ